MMKLFTETDEREALHEVFWREEGPGLILIPPRDAPLYETTNYAARFHDPVKMWEAEMERARSAIDWPTDGIPTVCPNLGAIFIPALAGQEYLARDDQMPCVLAIDLGNPEMYDTRWLMNRCAASAWK